MKEFIDGILDRFKKQEKSILYEPISAPKTQSQEHEMIMRDYDMVIKQNPSFVYAYFNRGNMRCNLRDFRAAIADYDEAIKHAKDLAAGAVLILATMSVVVGLLIFIPKFIALWS